jgi:hypothetical protein
LLDRGCLYAGVFTNCVDLIDTDPMFLKWKELYLLLTFSSLVVAH